MNIKIKLLFWLATIGLFATGCNKAAAPTPLYKMTQKKVVVNSKSFFYIPKHSTSYLVKQPWPYKYKVQTSGLLECPVGNSIVISSAEKLKALSVDQNYKSILSASELKTYYTHPTIFPKNDSSEYKNLVSTFTSIYKRGGMACYKPMTKKEVKQYKAYVEQQEKINNDPRVVAARINLQAAQMQELGELARYNEAKKERSKDRLNQSIRDLNANARSMQPIDVNVYHY